MTYNLQHSFLAAFGAVATAMLFVGASIVPAFSNASSLVI